MYSIFYIFLSVVKREMSKNCHSTSLRSVISRISITGGTLKLECKFSQVWWLHHQSNLHSHSCSLRCTVSLYLTQFLLSDNIFIALVKGCIFEADWDLHIIVQYFSIDVV